MFIIILTFIEKVRPHTFFEEIITEKVECRPSNPKSLVFAMIENRYDEFYFFDRELNIINEEEEIGGPKNYSPKYIIGNVYKLEEVGDIYGVDSILYNNMKINCIEFGVRTYLGRWVYQDKDMIVYQNL